MPEWSLSCPRLLSNDQQVETSFGEKACFQWTQQARQSPSVPSKCRPQAINQPFFSDGRWAFVLRPSVKSERAQTRLASTRFPQVIDPKASTSVTVSFAASAEVLNPLMDNQNMAGDQLVLPLTTVGKHSDLRYVSPEVLASVLDGQYSIGRHWG